MGILSEFGKEIVYTPNVKYGKMNGVCIVEKEPTII